MKKEVNYKIILLLCFFAIIVGGAFAGLIYYDYNKIELVEVDDYNFSSDIKFNIDKIEQLKEIGTISFRGWALKKDDTLKTYENYIVLKELETNKMLKVNTTLEKREDVTKSFNDSYNYDNSGFFAKMKTKYLKKGYKYEIYILYLSDNNKLLIPTNSYVTIE